MYERVRYPDERKVMERYLPGTPNSLKEVIEVEAVKRELVFYKSRLDGLIRHVEVIGVKMFEEFEDREDRRTYQSITLGTDEDSSREKIRMITGMMPIVRMSEKFARDPSKEAKDDEYKIVYLLGEGRVRISFHHADGAILQPVLMLKRKQATLEVDEEYMAFVKTFKRRVLTEKEIHRYLMRQKEMVMRFRNFVVDQAYQIHVVSGFPSNAPPGETARGHLRGSSSPAGENTNGLVLSGVAARRIQSLNTLKLQHFCLRATNRLRVLGSCMRAWGCLQWRGQQEAAITAARELEEKHLLALREGVAGASRPLFPSSERGARAAYGSDANGAADADKPNAQQTEEAPRRQNAEENAGPPIYTKHTLQPTVYDAARELLKTHTDEKEARETKQKKRENEEVALTQHRQVKGPGTLKRRKASSELGHSAWMWLCCCAQIDILAPYFIEFRGRPLDAATAELIAKRCKNDMRKRMLHRAAVTQQRLQEQQEKLRRLKEARQRRLKDTGHDTGFLNKEEEEGISLEEQQSEVVFKIRILEQRLHRNETQAIAKLNELEHLLLTDSRLAPMWSRDTFG